MKTFKDNPNQALLDMLVQLKKTTETLPQVMQQTMENLYSSFGDVEKEKFVNECKSQNMDEIIRKVSEQITAINK